MPSCVLRVAFETETELDLVLAWIPFEPLVVRREGKIRPGSSGPPDKSNSFNVLVSDHDGTDVDKQVADALRFMAQYRDSLKSLSLGSGIRALVLDFGSELPQDIAMRSHKFPWTLLAALAECHISLEVSVYLTGDSDSAPDEASTRH
jgi:hypothetical protein